MPAHRASPDLYYHNVQTISSGDSGDDNNDIVTYTYPVHGGYYFDSGNLRLERQSFHRTNPQSNQKIRKNSRG